MGIDPAALKDLIRRALDEDRAFDDITTNAIVSADAKGSARLVAREGCVVAGLDVFEACFLELDPGAVVKRLVPDGDEARQGATVARVSGSLRALLSGERTALNFVQRLSGIATLTRHFVDAVVAARPNEYPPLVKIKDTRKTTPLLRDLEKAAVVAGGGVNHRRDLAGAYLIKDNHIAVAGGIPNALMDVEGAMRARDVKSTGYQRIHWAEVECETIDQVKEALETGADELLLDNMDIETMTKAVAMAKEHGNRATEASGGVTLETVGEIAKTGVNSISVGALTHSAPAIDLSLEVEAR